MAHNLNRRADGSAAFYSLRQPAWHGLGQVVERPVADGEVLRLAGLDWEARRVGLYTSDMAVVDTHRAIVRSDTGAVLGVVGEGFEVLQNAEMLGYVRDLATAAGVEMTVETAGALGAGETVWVLAKVPSLGFAVGKDEAECYFLAAQGHGGNRTLNLMPTTVRVVCQNTLRMAGQAGRSLSAGFAIKHTASLRDRMAVVRNAYAQAVRDHERTREAWTTLAGVPSRADSLERIVRGTWTVAKDEGDRARQIRFEREAGIAAIRRSATCDVEGTAGTVFADLQAVTEWIDHNGGMKDNGRRFASTMLGGALDDAKGRAWEAALALV